GHYDDSALLPEVSGEEDAVVPEGIDRQLPIARGGFPVFPTFDLPTYRATDELDQNKEREISGANQETLLRRIRREIGKLVSARDRLLRRTRTFELLFGGSLHDEGEGKG